MARFRDVKQGKVAKKDSNTFERIDTAPIILRVKAFLTDMFMLMMPLLYITTYLVLDGKDDFQHNDMAKWITALIYGVMVVIFWIKAGQTPGMKAYGIKVVDLDSRKKILFFNAIIRYIFFILSASTLFLIFIPFFRKDRRAIQDIFTHTIVILDD